MIKIPRYLPIGLGLLLSCSIFLYSYLHVNKNSEASSLYTNTKSVQSNKVSSKAQVLNKSNTVTAPVNWLMPTGGSYPIIQPNDPIWIQVSKEKQRVYIMKGNEIIYTMVCSTGLDTSPDTSTPIGTFQIQKERGIRFYNPNEKEGAMYWVSWKNHGEFLFHSVATDENGNIIPSEAMKLGQKASHGCVRLAVPDAKWIFDNIKYNTKVVIG